MNSTFKKIVAATAVACVTLSTAEAQQSQVRNETRSGINDAGRLDAKTNGTNIRVSQLLGYNIQNSQGESVGEIKDIVVDSKTGKIKYAAVTYGGFLGMGNKLFAVPFAAFDVQVDPDEVGDDDIDDDDYVLILDVTQEQLEGQQGFDEENWPNMADRQWATELDKRYGVKRNMDAKDRLLRENRKANRNQ